MQRQKAWKIFNMLMRKSLRKGRTEEDLISSIKKHFKLTSMLLKRELMENISPLIKTRVDASPSITFCIVLEVAVSVMW